MFEIAADIFKKLAHKHIMHEGIQVETINTFES